MAKPGDNRACGPTFSVFPITVSTLKQGRLENEVFLCEREENGFTNDYILSTAMKHYFYRRKVLKRG